MAKNLKPVLEWLLGKIEPRMGDLSHVNRPVLKQFIRAKQAEGLALGSVYLYANTLSKLDMHHHGAAVLPGDPLMLRGFVNGKGSKATLWMHTTRTRAFFPWYYDEILDQETPR